MGLRWLAEVAIEAGSDASQGSEAERQLGASELYHDRCMRGLRLAGVEKFSHTS